MLQKTRLRQAAFFALIAASAVAMALVFQRFGRASGDALTFAYKGDTYELSAPQALGVCLSLPLLIWALGRSLADLPWPQRALALALRCSFLALLAVALGRFSRTATTSKVCTVYVVDVSESMPAEALTDARDEVARGLAARGKDDVVKLITFARRPRVVDLLDGGARAPDITRHDAEGQRGKLGSGSSVQAALQLAYGLFPPGYLKRVALVSDGLETDGDALAEAERARGFGVKISTYSTKRPVPGEVALREVVLPPKVRVGDAFEIKADVYASRKTTARARLFQGETLNGLDGVRKLELAPGPNQLVFKSIVRVAGEVTYSLELDEIGDDTFKENNKIAVTVDVPGRPTVLYVEGSPSHASYLQAALGAQQLDVEVRTPGAFPASLKELERFDFLVVSDVPADKLGLDAQGLIESFVRDLGGGFLFAGGENGYALGGWQHSTVERILPVRMDSEKKKDMPSVALSLVIDRSGSMNGTPMEMAKAAAKAAVDVLQPDDVVEVIAFDTQPMRAVKMTSARRKGRIASDIAKIQPGGGTDIFPALDAAFQDLSVTQARRKHVILLTDGVAPINGIRQVVQAMAGEGITVTTVGLGTNLDDNLLSMIKDVGGGRYHKVPDPQNLPKVFTAETEVVARQSAQEDWFPVTVTQHAGFLAGIDMASAPNLHGYVSTKLKPAPAQQILASDKGEPILARWHVGIGWSLAWTSDVKNRWAVEWLRWPGFSQFFGQLVREHMRVKHRRELDMKVEIAGGEVRATVDAFGVDDRFENGLDSTLSVIGPAPSKDKRELPMRQVAPGRYESAFVLDRFGSFLLRAEHARGADDGKRAPVAASYGHVNNPYPPEYARFEPDRELLRRIASSTGGAFEPPPAALFDAGGEKITFHEALWPKVVMASIALFLLDLLVRRVRIFDRKALPMRLPSR